MSLLQVSHLKIDFETNRGDLHAVDDISFELHDGETLGIVGESGCGKTVTALALMRLLPSPPARYSGGEIIFEGQNILAMSQSEILKIRGSRISMIFQEPMTSLNPVFTVGDQIREAIILHQGASRREAKIRTIEIMQRVKIPDAEQRFDCYPHQMSGGLKQRVMIAMALSCRPKLLIADEPTTALDVTIQAQILDLIKELQIEYGMAMLIITHDFGVIAETVDRVHVMYAGKIVEKSTTQRIFDFPQHPYTLGLQRAIPSFVSSMEPLYTIPGTVPDLRHPPIGCRFVERCEYRKQQCNDKEPDLELNKEASSLHETACFYPGGSR